MATKFLEPGGDATFNAVVGSSGGFWGAATTASSGAIAVATDFVNGGHLKSIRFSGNGLAYVTTPAASVSDSGARVSFYLYIAAAPVSAFGKISTVQTSGGTSIYSLYLSQSRVLTLYGGNTQIGVGSTLALSTWYRISYAYTITSTTVNRFEVFLNGISDISTTNVTLLNTGSDKILFGKGDSESSYDSRMSDFYVDDSSALTDTGNIWVTAKRPNANGSSNSFATQIGSGGSGVGTGHSPQVNERPYSATNGWQGTASQTEEYTIESASTGDIDISTAIIVDYMGWAVVQAVLAANNQLIVGGTNNAKSTTTGVNMFTAAKGSSTYPAGNTDIGWTTSATAGSYKLYECGILFAYTPPITPSVFDSVTITENISLKIPLPVSVSDNVTITENITIKIPLPVSVSDNVTITENISLKIPLPASVSDNVTITENISLKIPLPVSVSDNVTITENISLKIPLPINISDSTTVTENIIITISATPLSAFPASQAWGLKILDF